MLALSQTMPAPAAAAGVPNLHVCDAAAPRRLERALADLGAGLARWRLAAALARLDLRNRYRGSVLGPLWLTLSTAVMVGALGLLYSSLFRLDLANYLPWLATSLILWGTIQQLVTDGCGTFIAAEGIIRQMPLPYSVHVLRCLFRNAMIAAHNLPLILAVLLLFGTLPGPEALLALPGLALIGLDAIAAGLFLGMLCARFRDIGPIVTNFMQLAFFVSPVIWKPELLGPVAAWLPLNPFYSLLEVVRGPLISGGAGGMVWLSAILWSVLACGVALAFFVRFRSRIAFWV